MELHYPESKYLKCLAFSNLNLYPLDLLFLSWTDCLTRLSQTTHYLEQFSISLESLRLQGSYFPELFSTLNSAKVWYSIHLSWFLGDNWVIYHQVGLETTFSHRTTTDEKFPTPNEITPVVTKCPGRSFKYQGECLKSFFSIEVESLFSKFFFWQFDGSTSIEQRITACFWPISIAWMLACELAFRLVNRQVIKVVNIVLIIHGVVKWSLAHPYWTVLHAVSYFS